MAAINKFVSTKNRRMFFPDFFFNVTTHLADYHIDVNFLKVFLKLFPVPPGQNDEVGDIGIEVVEVRTIEEAMRYAI